jgi:hypothetical protein
MRVRIRPYLAGALCGLLLYLSLHFLTAVVQPMCATENLCTSVTDYGLAAPLCAVDPTCLSLWPPSDQSHVAAGLASIPDARLVSGAQDLRYLSWTGMVSLVVLSSGYVLVAKSADGLLNDRRYAGLQTILILESLHWTSATLALFGGRSLLLVLAEAGAILIAATYGLRLARRPGRPDGLC